MTLSPCHAMDTARKSAQQLREQISKAEEELRSLREQLAQTEAHEKAQDQDQVETSATSANVSAWKWPLQADEYDRYGRQLILPNVGIQGQTTSFSHCYAVTNTLLQANRGSRPPRSSSSALVGLGARQRHTSPGLEWARWASWTATS